MTRDLDALAGTSYDLLVVGGGIHGLFAAYDAAARGMAVAVVDRADFGSGLSFNHQRTLHGGLRALQRLDVRACRQQIAERRTWARIAPHLLRPLPFLIGTYRTPKRSRVLFRAGLRLYDGMARRRNHDVPPELHLPACRLESRAATRKLFPAINEVGLTGGAVWYDYRTLHPDRLTWCVALAAARYGATLANYVDVVAPVEANGTIIGAYARDALTGQALELRARRTLLVAGSGLAPLHERYHCTGAPPLLQAMNVLIDRPAHDIALVAPSANGRMLTAVPWREMTLVGTAQSSSPVSPATPPPGPAEVEAFLHDANQAFPRLAATMAHVRLVHHGLVPAQLRGSSADLLAAPHIIDHARQRVPGVFSLVGVKYTTARLAAERAVDAVVGSLDARRPHGSTDSRFLPHGEVADTEGRIVECERAGGLALDADVVRHLAGWYGTEAVEVLTFAQASGHGGRRLTAASPVLAAEVAYAADRSLAVRLSDVVLRRTPLGSAGHPGAEALTAAADMLSAACGWDRARRDEELADVRRAWPAPD